MKLHALTNAYTHLTQFDRILSASGVAIGGGRCRRRRNAELVHHRLGLASGLGLACIVFVVAGALAAAKQLFPAPRLPSGNASDNANSGESANHDAGGGAPRETRVGRWRRRRSRCRRGAWTNARTEIWINENMKTRAYV